MNECMHSRNETIMYFHYSAPSSLALQVIRRLLTSYFDVIRKKIIDSVPKAITLTLIQKV